MKSRFAWFCSFLIVFSPVTAIDLTADDPANAELNPAEIRKLQEKVTRPFDEGNSPLMVAGISDLLRSSSSETLDAIDVRLVEENYAPLAEMALHVWIKSIEQGTVDELPKLKWPMAALILPRIEQQISEMLAEQKRHPLMKKLIDYPNGFQAYEDGLWDLHVFEKQLGNALKISLTAEQLIKPFQRKFDTLTENDSRLAPDFSELAAQIRTQQTQLAEQSAEVRYYRLEDAAATLATATDFETRLRAAFALEYDALVLKNFFNSHPDPKRENLRSGNIEKSITSLVTEGREKGTDVIHKAKLLHVGMHWWIRGRYGAGPLRWGLLKSPLALRSAADQFPLYMPVDPIATNPFNNQPQSQAPQYDRRHYYISAAEQNKIQDRIPSYRTTKFFH